MVSAEGDIIGIDTDSAVGHEHTAAARCLSSQSTHYTHPSGSPWSVPSRHIITGNAFSPKGPSLSVASHIVTFAPSLQRIICRPLQSDPWRAASEVLPRVRLCVTQFLLLLAKLLPNSGHRGQSFLLEAQPKARALTTSNRAAAGRSPCRRPFGPIAASPVNSLRPPTSGRSRYLLQWLH